MYKLVFVKSIREPCRVPQTHVTYCLTYREERLKAIAEAKAAAKKAEEAAAARKKALEEKAAAEEAIDLTGEIAALDEELDEEMAVINNTLIGKISPETAAEEAAKLAKEKKSQKKKRGRPLGSGKSLLILPREELSEEDTVEFNLRVTVKTGAELTILEDAKFMETWSGKVAVICMDKPWGCMKDKKGGDVCQCIHLRVLY